MNIQLNVTQNEVTITIPVDSIYDGIEVRIVMSQTIKSLRKIFADKDSYENVFSFLELFC